MPWPPIPRRRRVPRPGDRIGDQRFRSSRALSDAGEEKMTCPRCGTVNSTGRRFCAECGSSLAFACPSCGFSNEPGVKFCGGCGAALSVTRPAGSQFAAPERYTPKHLAEKILTSKTALE